MPECIYVNNNGLRPLAHACMLKFNSVLSAVARSNFVLDLAVETKNLVVKELKAAAIALVGLGFGAALLLGGIAMLTASGFGSVHGGFASAFTGISLGAGAILVIACGTRVKRANDRLNALKDTLSAKGARDAASRLASASIDMAMNGAASAQEFARSAASQATDSISRLFQKKGAEPEAVAADTEIK